MVVLETDANSLPVSSSKPPAFTPEQVELFCDVLSELNRRAVPYAVSGAFALQHHTGIWRDTKDLDVFLPAEHASTTLKHLKEEGFSCEITDPLWLAKVRRGNYFVDLITGMSNGVINVDQSWIDRASPAPIMGVPTKVLAAEELLASKLFVLFRERFDGADMAHIIYATRGRLDWQRILCLVGEHRGLLFSILTLFNYIYPASGSYVPSGVWNFLIADLQQSFAEPDPQANFRGTLLDEKMFAIDVKEWGLPDLIVHYRALKSEWIRERMKVA